MTKDRTLIFISACLRGCAISLSSVVIALHLSTLGFSVFLIGLTLAAGLTGSALSTAVVVFLSGKLDKRKTLVGLAFLMSLGGFLFAFSTTPALVLSSALLGMVNGMGRDRGASNTLEQAILPNTIRDAGRTMAFAWYNVLMDMGHAVGALLGFIPALFRTHAGMDTLASYQWTWGIYSLICLLSGLAIGGISGSVKNNGQNFYATVSSPSRPLILKFATLSGLDSLGGGFLTTALLSFWFFKRFGVDEAILAPLFFAARVANLFSHFGAAWLARRIGLVKTMVFTHIPSSLLLMTVPFMPNLAVATVLFLLRESLVEMDVPTRQSYLAAVVKPHERIRAAGLANLARGFAWGAGPLIAGAISKVSLSLPILAGPALKIVYDILLYHQFVKIKPPEEISTTGA